LSGKKKLEKRSPILRLGILDRINIPQILPGKGARLTLQVAEDIRKKIRITIEEQKRIKYREELVPGTSDFRIEWDKRKEVEIEVRLTPLEADLLKKTVNFLDQQEQILKDWMPTCDKIVEL